MACHQFTLVLDHVPNEEEIEALYEAGADDATIGSEGGYGVAEFEREADSLAAAIVSAVHDVETTGLIAVRVIDEDLLTLADIAERIGRSRENVRLWALGQRGGGGFPPPVNLEATKGEVRFWRWSEVVPWLHDHGIEATHRNTTLTVASLALQFRAASRTADDIDPLRTLVA